MNKRCIALLLAMVLGLSLLTGCGGSDNGGQTQTPESVAPSTKLSKPPAEDQIMYDVNEFHYTVLPENTEITECEIIKRQSNPEDKEDIVYCRLIGPEDGFKYSQYYVRLLYNFYDEGGWILDEMTADQVDQWGVIGYLDGEGKPIEDGMVHISDYDEDSEVIISNDGWWANGGAVYDMQGEKIGSVTGVTRAGRYTVTQNGLVYLCDSDGKKLSAGYEEIGYAGAITDDNEQIIDHRWYVFKDGLLGCLDDNGQEVIPLKYDGDENYFGLSFNGGNSEGNGRFGKLATLKDGDGRLVVNSDGKELIRYDSDTGLWVYTYGDGYTVKDENYRGNGNYYSVYNSDGKQLFSGAYRGDICANTIGVAIPNYRNENQVYPDWVAYDWDGNQIGTVSNRCEFEIALPLGGNLYNVGISGYVFDNSRGYNILDDSSGVKVYGNHISTFTPCGVFDEDGNYIIYPEYEDIGPVGSGLYVVLAEDGSMALFDWQGNQRTQFFDSIVQYSENGQYFIVIMDGEPYAMKTPLSTEELEAAPVYDAKW